MHIALTTTNPSPFLNTSQRDTFPASLLNAFTVCGHQVSVVAPGSRDIDPDAHSLARRLKPIEVLEDGETTKYARYEGRSSTGIALHILANEGPAHIDAEPDQKADLNRFCRAAVACLDAVGDRPDWCISIADGSAPPTSLLQQQGLETRGMSHLLIAVGIDPGHPTLDKTFAAADRVVIMNRYLNNTAASDEPLSIDRMAAAGLAVSMPWPRDSAAPLSAHEKASAKAALQIEANLPVRPDVLLVVIDEAGSLPLGKVLDDLLTRDIQVVVNGETLELDQLIERYPDRLARLKSLPIDGLYQAADGCVVGGDPRTISTALSFGTVPVAVPETRAMLVDIDPSLNSGTGILVAAPTPHALNEGLGRLMAAFEKRAAFKALIGRLPGYVPTWEEVAADCLQLIGA